MADLQAEPQGAEEFDRTAVTYGFSEKDGNVRVAFANTFWLPPAEPAGEWSEPMFADFREVACVDRDHFDASKRVRAMTHEARLYLIRRKIYFRYRWNLSIDDVRRTEAERISGDPAFTGPRPDWAAA